MLEWLLGLDVIDGPLPWAIWVLTAAAAVALLIRSPQKGWGFRALIGVLVGGILGFGTALFVEAVIVTTGLPAEIKWWVTGTFAVIGLAIVSLWKSAVWRKVVAIILIVLALASAALGVNRAFGIDRTLGAMVGVSSLEQIDDLGNPHPNPTPTGPAYENWTPPADMPAKGKIGLLSGASAIPSSAGFKPRDASIYLPPAAQVKGGPALPLVVMMMGKPGNPDPTFIAAALDDLAAKNKGLAPIVIIADQLGDPNQDPVCTDSKTFGGVDTYFNKDIVEYAKSKLPIIQDPKYWTIAGYSNGGACAFTWAAEHPEIWGNLVSISGDEFQGVEDQGAAVREGFDGDANAYDAAKPAAWLQKNAGKFTGHVAVFTVGQNDPGFVPGAERNAKLAETAGFATTYYVVPGAGHVVDALNGGIPHAFEILYPHLGLSAPH